ncbi:MAG TPA: exosortase/archaeosortase family protein [Verrucomicrobiae bacterium]|nr:exosortase/archaeosortase family protein [Verrucomicrobiae bacterium]
MSEHAQAQSVNGSVGVPQEPGFLEEAADLFRRLPHKVLFGILFGAWIALFHFYGNATLGYVKSASLFDWARGVYAWAGGDDAHGAYIPYAVPIFLWLKRKELAEVSARIWWPAVLYFGFAVLLHFAAFRVQQARVSVLAFILGLHALIGLVWGPVAMRRTVFPIFLLLFCIPFGSLADPITFKLRMLVTKVSVAFAHDVLGIQVFRDGSQILGESGRALYDVAPACSGMRSLVAMSALAVIYAFLNFDSVWRRAVLIGFALPIAVFGNIARITTVIIVGDVVNQKAAVAIEQKFGFVTFLVAIVLLMALGWLIRERPVKAAAKPEQPVLKEEAV